MLNRKSGQENTIWSEAVVAHDEVVGVVVGIPPSFRHSDHISKRQCSKPSAHLTWGPPCSSQPSGALLSFSAASAQDLLKHLNFRQVVLCDPDRGPSAVRQRTQDPWTQHWARQTSAGADESGSWYLAHLSAESNTPGKQCHSIPGSLATKYSKGSFHAGGIA